MQTGTKVVLAVVVVLAVPVTYVAAAKVGVVPTLTPACVHHGLSYCSKLGFGDCSMNVTASSCTSIAVEEPELHLCGSHIITWNLTSSEYTFPDNGIEFKHPIPGAFVNPVNGTSYFSWRATGRKGDYPYTVNLKDAQNQPCVLDPVIYSE